MWPAIWRLVEEEVEQAYRDGTKEERSRSCIVLNCFSSRLAGYKVCVVDAAVLLQAEWDRRLHEVWVSIISPKEV